MGKSTNQPNMFIVVFDIPIKTITSNPAYKSIFCQTQLWLPKSVVFEYSAKPGLVQEQLTSDMSNRLGDLAGD